VLGRSFLLTPTGGPTKLGPNALPIPQQDDRADTTMGVSWVDGSRWLPRVIC
jgi:hypothetical protein